MGRKAEWADVRAGLMGAEKAIMVCRELGLLDLDEMLWLVPRQVMESAHLIGPGQQRMDGGIA